MAVLVIVLPTVFGVIVLVLLLLFCYRTAARRKLIYRLLHSNARVRNFSVRKNGGDIEGKSYKQVNNVEDKGYNEKQQPLINEESETDRRCRILGGTWKEELLKYKRIKIRPGGHNCNFVCKEIRRQLSKVEFVEANWDIFVVVALKEARVQDDAESALEQIGHNKDQKDSVILLMFHHVAGGKTKADVNLVMYKNPNVKLTFHVPFAS